MSPIRGEQKIDAVKVRVVLPQPLLRDVDEFVAFNNELGRSLTLDVLAAAAVRDALATDKEFQTWRKSRQASHAPAPGVDPIRG